MFYLEVPNIHLGFEVFLQHQVFLLLWPLTFRDPGEGLKPKASKASKLMSPIPNNGLLRDLWPVFLSSLTFFFHLLQRLSVPIFPCLVCCGVFVRTWGGFCYIYHCFHCFNLIYVIFHSAKATTPSSVTETSQWSEIQALKYPYNISLQQIY